MSALDGTRAAALVSKPLATPSEGRMSSGRAPAAGPSRSLTVLPYSRRFRRRIGHGAAFGGPQAAGAVAGCAGPLAPGGPDPTWPGRGSSPPPAFPVGPATPGSSLPSIAPTQPIDIVQSANRRIARRPRLGLI